MSSAHHLRELGIEYQVFERNAYAGGHVITREESGFRFDLTGHLLHLRDPEMRKLAMGWIGDDWVEVHRKSFVWSHGVYTRYPYQANTFGLPAQVAYECLMGFIEAQMAKDVPAPKNFEEFCLMKFGKGISEHFMIPYNSRLWGVHPREITAEWCSRFVPLPSLSDVVAGAVGANDRELGYNASFVYPRLGIGQLSKNMAKTIGGIRYERQPIAIDELKRELIFADGEVVSFQTLISTAPLKELCKLLRHIPDKVRDAADKLRCNPLWYLDVALDVPCGQPIHWIYVPEAKYPYYRLGCYSNFSAALAPPGKSCLYIELSDRKEPDLVELLPKVAEGLQEMRIIDAPSQILFARARKIDYAYVVFDHAYFESVATVQQYLQEQKIVSAGRYGGWNYSSMEDALIFGRDASKVAAGYLR
jgi:protoporphyrinogen oxidase